MKLLVAHYPERKRVRNTDMKCHKSMASGRIEVCVCVCNEDNLGFAGCQSKEPLSHSTPAVLDLPASIPPDLVGAHQAGAS